MVNLNRRTLKYLVLAVLAVLLWGYWRLLQDHGTMMPLFSLLYSSTAPHVSMARPSGWTPASRVVVSLTTMPHDVAHLNEVLDSLRNQTVQPDVIYVNLPKKCRRNGETYNVPSWLEEYPRVKINRPDTDYGPLTKLFPALEAESDPDTIIVTVDDDKVYSPHMLEHVVWYSEQDPEVVWGICGWSFMWVPPPQGVISVYTSWYLRLWHGRNTDVLQGVCGIAYRRKFFPDLAPLSNPHPDCFLTDDMWISGYLNLFAHRKRVLTPGPWDGFWALEPSDSPWLKQSRVGRLSDTSKTADKDIKCVRGVTERFGPWAHHTARIGFDLPPPRLPGAKEL